MRSRITSQLDACAVLGTSHFSSVLRTTKTQTRFLIRILANSPLLRPHSLINMQMAPPLEETPLNSTLYTFSGVRVALEAASGGSNLAKTGSQTSSQLQAKHVRRKHSSGVEKAYYVTDYYVNENR